MMNTARKAAKNDINHFILPSVSEVKRHTFHLSELSEAVSQFFMSHGPADAADVHNPALILCENIQCNYKTNQKKF